MTKASALAGLDNMLKQIRELDSSYGQVIIPRANLIDALHIIRQEVAEIES